MAAASNFMLGFITAMMLFLVFDYGFPIWLGASVLIAGSICCICVNKLIP